MTYCVGLKLNAGLVLLSDTRTNAGLDNIACYRKMFFFEEPGERVVAIMTAGSLSVTQTALARLDEAIEDEMADETTSILKAPTMLQVATIIGDTLARTRREIAEQCRDLRQQASASMIVAGQRKGDVGIQEPRLVAAIEYACVAERVAAQRLSGSGQVGHRDWLALLRGMHNRTFEDHIVSELDRQTSR